MVLLLPWLAVTLTGMYNYYRHINADMKRRGYCYIESGGWQVLAGEIGQMTGIRSNKERMFA